MKTRLFAIVFAMCAVLPFACGKDGVDNAPVKGHIVVTQYFPLSRSDVDQIYASGDERMLSAIENGGWKHTERGMERSKVMDPKILMEEQGVYFTFEVDGQVLPVVEDGSIVFPTNPKDDAVVKLIPYHVGDEEKMGEEFTTPNVQFQLVRNEQGDTDIEIVWDKSAATHNHQKINESQPWTCRDYNGPFGNCVNYSTGKDRYSNFLYSDCDMAWSSWGLCWMDFTSWRFCDNRTRNCSFMISHLPYHHCH